MSGHEHHYAAGFEDVPQCLDCGRRLDMIRYGPGAMQCWDCRNGYVRPQPVIHKSVDEWLAANRVLRSRVGE